MPILLFTNIRFFVFAHIVVAIISSGVVSCSIAYADEGIIWDRFRLLPALNISEKHSDNIYLTAADRRQDAVTTLSPQVSLDFAIAPDNYLKMSYEGNFSLHSTAHNFKHDSHKAGASWEWMTAKGSLFKIGAALNVDSMQPYAEDDSYKSFTDNKWFGETILALTMLTGIGVSYEHMRRDFEKTRYSSDDYDRDSVTVQLSSKRLPDGMITAAYSYFHQDNKDVAVSYSDVDSHIFLIGAQWDPSNRLYGHLKGGYYRIMTEDGSDSSGFAVDTNLGYRVTDATLFTLTAFRKVAPSTQTARESGTYYTSTGGGLKMTYSGVKDLMCAVTAYYRHNEFTPFGTEPGTERKDDYFDAGLSMRYAVQRWISFVADYRHRVNYSSVDAEEYRENTIQFQVRFAL